MGLKLLFNIKCFLVANLVVKFETCDWIFFCH